MNSSPSITRTRFGFTLIELLFVIAIMAVLSTMALGVMKSAQDDAKTAATLSRIQQIESILQVELEDYEVRRIPVPVSTLVSAAVTYPLYGDGDSNGQPDYLGLQVRNLKRRILQDIINAELPRPLVSSVDGSFIFNPDLGIFPTRERSGTSLIGFDEWLMNNYSGLEGILAGVASSRVQAWANFKATLVTNGTTAEFNLPGEYLYQTLVTMDFDGAPAIEILGNQAIGDSDGDGFLEVVDAWGDPLQLRIWQVNADQVTGATGSTAPLTPGVTDVWEDQATDFDVKAANGIPTGYAVLDPKVPREINKIRFEVISTRLVY